MRSGVVDVAAPTQSGMPTPDFLPEEPETSAQRLMHLQRFTLPYPIPAIRGCAAAVVNSGWEMLGWPPLLQWRGWTELSKRQMRKPSGSLPGFRVLYLSEGIVQTEKRQGRFGLESLNEREQVHFRCPNCIACERDCCL